MLCRRRVLENQHAADRETERRRDIDREYRVVPTLYFYFASNVRCVTLWQLAEEKENEGEEEEETPVCLVFFSASCIDTCPPSGSLRGEAGVPGGRAHRRSRKRVILLLQFQLAEQVLSLSLSLCLPRSLSANHDRKRFLCAQSYATLFEHCSFSLSFCFVPAHLSPPSSPFCHIETHTYTLGIYTVDFLLFLEWSRKRS